MGPRLGGRGDTLRSNVRIVFYRKLQWGRGSVAAETIVILTGSQAIESLQWGRGSVAAETAHHRH